METVAVFILCCLKVSFTGASIFWADPDNVTVAVGGVATLECVLNQDYECAKVGWVFSKSVCDEGSFSTIGVCHAPSLIPSVDTTRFSISFKGNSSQYQISDVHFSDAGMYACWLADINTFSNCAHLKVVHPPTPICSTSSKSAVVGDRVSLNCKVPEESVVSTKLTWHTPKTDTHNNVNPGSSHTVQLVLTETDNYKKFMCIAGNSAEGPNCLLTPLQIDIIVAVSFLEFNAQDSSIKFECVAIAVPEATEFDWAVKTGFPNDIDQTWVDVRNESRRRFELTSNLLTLYNLTELDTGRQVRCTAHNVIGMSKTSEPVTVLQCPDGRFVTGDIDECNRTVHEAWNFSIALIIIICILSAFFLLMTAIAVIRKRKSFRVTVNNLPDSLHISSSVDIEQTNAASIDRVRITTAQLTTPRQIAT